jgi:hypothetical protein
VFVACDQLFQSIYVTEYNCNAKQPFELIVHQSKFLFAENIVERKKKNCEMMMKKLLVVAAILACVGVACADELLLTVAYCPTAFTGAGALVSVDTSTGAYSIKSTFDWPAEIFGCPALYDPAVTSSKQSKKVYLDFIDEFGLMVELDTVAGKVSGSTQPDDEFFHGFTAFVPPLSSSSNVIYGTTPTVEKKGSPYCSDGCFQIAGLTLGSGAYANVTDVPFKEAADDVALAVNGSLYVTQMADDLRPDGQRCAPAESDECLVTVDLASGELVSAHYTNYTIYQFADAPVGAASGAAMYLTWMFGFEEKCRHPYNDFLFAQVDIESAAAVPIACIPHNVTVDFQEWISSFSSDQSLFATASGDSEGDPSQLLVFSTKDGSVVVDSDLGELPRMLHAWSKLVFIWGVDFFPQQ